MLTADTDTSRSNRILVAFFFFLFVTSASISTLHRFHVRTTTVNVIGRCGGTDRFLLNNILQDASSLDRLQGVRYSVLFLEVFWRDHDTQYHLAGKSLNHPDIGYQCDVLVGRGLQTQGETVTSMENMFYSTLELGDSVSILNETFVLVGATNITMPMIVECVEGVEAKPSSFFVVENGDLERCAKKLASAEGWEDSHGGFVAQVVIGVQPRSRIDETVSKIRQSTPYLDLVTPRIDNGYEKRLERRYTLSIVAMAAMTCLASMLVFGSLRYVSHIYFIPLMVSGIFLGIAFSLWGA